jgi:zinc transport system substrate-binding protein
MAIIALFLAAALPGCVRENRDVKQLRVAAAIAPIADLVHCVAGDAWAVYTIVPPGISAHVFEPSPSDAARLSKVQLVVTVGGGYDGWVEKMVEATASQVRVIDTSAALGLTGEEHEEDGHDHDHEHGHTEENDPHWWLSPRLAAKALPSLANGLASIDPAGREGYFERAKELEVQILELDREIEERLTPAKGKSFVSAHPAWSHFASRYGLIQAGSIEPAPGRDPSPWELRKLIDQARGGGFKVLFTEPQFSRAAAEAIASDAGLSLALLDPIGGVPGRQTYLETMRYNSTVFASGMAATGRTR